MVVRLRTFALCLWLLGPAWAEAEVLVRWDQDRIPSRESVGLSAIVVPARRTAVVKSALAEGYRVYLEVEASALAGLGAPARGVAGFVVAGDPTPQQLAGLRRRLAGSGVTVRAIDGRGKWPHIRSNWVTSENGVLQVSSRTAQPWVENNAALMRIAQTMRPDERPLVSYPWQPTTPSGTDEGPVLEDYLVALAEAGSFGADLVLPLHERFQTQLLLATPRARGWWREIRRSIEFYAWDLPGRYEVTADVGVVTAGDPMRWFEVMNLLARHNLPFELIAQGRAAAGDLAKGDLAKRDLTKRDLTKRDLSKLDLVIVLDQPDAAGAKVLQAFASGGGTVVLAGLKGSFSWHGTAPAAKAESMTTWNVGKGQVVELAQPVADPNEFALQMRRLVGDRRRVIQIWNGITVLAAHYAAPEADTALVTLLNYTQLPVEVQIRIPGLFSAVHYESPGEEPVLLPYRQRDGFTELVVPALRIGARLFLTGDGGTQPGTSR